MARIDELLRIMARLRDPESGCPWDLDQDFASISPHTIEEAYEVDEAIARGDPAALCDELGDLLFQVVFQARIAEELSAFDFAAVVDSICAKLVRRHPHIFAGAPSPGSAAAQVANWEAIKAAERAADATGSASSPADALFAGIPRALPSLMRSAKLRGRMDRSNAGRGLAEVRSEAAVRAALAEVACRTAEAEHHVRTRIGPSATGSVSSGDARRAEREASEAVIGAGIRAWVELARQLGIDPEQALRREDDRAIGAARVAGVHQAGTEPHR